MLCPYGFCISEASVAQWLGTGKVSGEKYLLKQSQSCLCCLCENAHVGSQK